MYWRGARAVPRLRRSAALRRPGHDIVRPPGSLLSSVADFLFSPKTVELVVKPIISDLQVEYCDAVAAKRRVKAAWVRIRGYWGFFKGIGLYSILKMFVEMWRKVILS
jgi:hypothetical protein